VEPTSFATDEDREEWNRWQTDRSIMVAELGGRVGQLQVSADDEKMDVDSQLDKNHDHKENHPFLLQLPPVLADLIDADKIVKSEPRASARSGQVGRAEASSSSTAGQSGPTGPVEQRDEEVIAIKEDPEPKVSIFPEKPRHLPKLESGYVGKLRVYKSGKTELDWGGINLEMKKGITPKFLQDIVMIRVKTPDGAPAGQASNAVEGEALSFGQVRGKFIVTPDFDEIFR
jgi:DNA-directed RNA polymerase III subunit RPC4